MTKLIIILLMMAANLYSNEYLIAIPPNEAAGKGIFKSIEIYVLSNKPTYVKLEYNKDSIIIIKETNEFGFCKFSTIDNEIKKWWEVRQFGIPDNETIRISSFDDITVYVKSSKLNSSEGYLALPIEQWGYNYIHCNYYEYSEFGSQFWPRGTGFIVVSNEDNTLLEIILRGTDSTKTTDGFIVGDTLNIRLDRNELYAISTTMDNPFQTADFTGTKINSNKPIGIISFNMRTKIPALIKGDGRDPLYEMLPSIDKWNYNYIALGFKRQGGGDYFRLIASQDLTKWYCKYYNYLTGDLIDSIGGILNESEWFEYKELDSINQSIEGVSFWHSNKPTMLMQYSYSGSWEGVNIFDPFMVVIPSEIQYKNYIKFYVPEGYDNYINIISTGYFGNLYLDSVKVNNIDIKFQYNKIDEYYYVRLKIESGIHELYGTDFYAIGYGFSVLDSYGWILNPVLLNINSTPQINIQSYDFGFQRINKTYFPYQQILLIENFGTDNLIIDSIRIDGDINEFGLEYLLDSLTNKVILQGGNYYFPITFKPRDTINYQSIITIYNNAKDTFSILKGIGIAPGIAISDVNFGTTIINDYKFNKRKWFIGNDGTDDVLVYDVKITGDNSFTYIKQFPITIPPDSLYELEAQFKASEVGYSEALVQTISDAMKEDTAQWHGWGIEKKIKYSITCGYSCINFIDTLFLELENYGSADVKIESMNIQNNKDVFIFDDYFLLNGFILKPNEKRVIIILFIPKIISYINTELIIKTDIPQYLYINLEGVGYMNTARLDLIVEAGLNIDIGNDFTLPIYYSGSTLPNMVCILEYAEDILLPIRDSIKVSDELKNIIVIDNIDIGVGRLLIKLKVNDTLPNDYGKLLDITWMTYLPNTDSKFVDIKLNVYIQDSCYSIQSRGGKVYLNAICAANLRRVLISGYETRLININNDGLVNYSLGIKGDVSLEIYNLSGDLIIRVRRKDRMPGMDFWTVGTSLLNGTYFCRMLFADFSQTLKFQIAK